MSTASSRRLLARRRQQGRRDGRRVNQIDDEAYRAKRNYLDLRERKFAFFFCTWRRSLVLLLATGLTVQGLLDVVHGKPIDSALAGLVKGLVDQTSK